MTWVAVTPAHPVIAALVNLFTWISNQSAHVNRDYTEAPCTISLCVQLHANEEYSNKAT